MSPRHWITDPFALLCSAVIAIAGVAVLGLLLVLEVLVDGGPMQ